MASSRGADRPGSRSPRGLLILVLAGFLLLVVAGVSRSAPIGGEGFAAIGMALILLNRQMADTWQLRGLGPEPVRRAIAGLKGAVAIFIGVQPLLAPMPY